jgi:two-component system chemotaxis response regulator CheB
VTIEAGRAPVESFDMLRKRVKTAAAERRSRPRGAPARPLAAAGPGAKLIAIGASTGGVEALVQVLSAFPRACPPTVVVQHMPPFFTTSFAARLDTVCAPRVHEAWDGAPLDRGVVYLAPGGPAHLEVVWGATRKVRLVGIGAVGVLLTGMGRDGAEGLLAMRRSGARTLAQDRDSSTVYGMPRAALEIGAVDRGTPLSLIASAIFSSEAPQKEAV